MAVLFPRDLQAKITSEGDYDDNGKWVEPTKSLITFSGDAQSLSQKEIDNLEIGVRNLGKIKIFTDYALTVADEEQKIKGDYVLFDDGNEYEVISVNKQRSGILENTEYIAELRKGKIRN